jgi:hypothetical protein
MRRETDWNNGPRGWRVDFQEQPCGVLRSKPLKAKVHFLAAALAQRGFVTPSGRQHSASAIASMLVE